MDDKRAAAPERILEEWREGVSYKTALGLTETVQRCEDFFIGDQWKGVNAPGLDKPVFNILKQVVNHVIANIVSNDIGISLNRFASQGEWRELTMPPDGLWRAENLGRQITDVLRKQVEECFELCDIQSANRMLVRDSAVDGDGCLHFWFDPEEDPQNMEEAGGTPGVICCEQTPNTAVYFGNPQSVNVQKQPYIIIQYRMELKQAKELARRNGQDSETVQTDRDETGVNTEHEQGKVTILRKYWLEKEPGAGMVARPKLHYAEVTAGGAVIREDTRTEQTRYPLVWMPWERQKNCMHGKGAVEYTITNQIAINKLKAMALQSMKHNAFPKVIYDRTKIQTWSNRIGEAIAVNGNPTEAIASAWRGADISPQVLALLADFNSQTKETMGASEAALGNVNPENTSAIVAVQKANTMPLQLQKAEWYRCVEEYVRICLDLMACYYGIRPVEVKLDGQEGESVYQIVPLDFGSLAGTAMRLNVEIGEASYWSELNELSTLTNLRTAGLLSDLEYMKRIPTGYIQDKEELVEQLKKRQEQAEMMAEMEQSQQTPAAEMGGIGNGEGLPLMQM